MHSRFKRRFVIGAAALTLAAGGGAAYAATQSSTNPRQAFLNDAAKRLGVTPQQLDAAIKGALTDQLDAAVKAGKLTQAQANAIEQRVQRAGGIPLWFGGRPGPLGRFMPGRGGFGFGARGGVLSGAASYLGLTPAQLRTQLESGKTLAQVAAARGKSVSGLEAAITKSIQSKLAAAVSAGRITKAQEQEILSMLTARLDRIVKGGLPAGPGGLFRGSRGWQRGAPAPQDGAPPALFGGPPPGAPPGPGV